jgi:hypothetical protein
VAELVYILCALTSTFCALLLVRSYLQRRVPLLLWSSLCFVGLALNNILLWVDAALGPEPELALARGLIALVGVLSLVIGLAWGQR